MPIFQLFSALSARSGRLTDEPERLMLGGLMSEDLRNEVCEIVGERLRTARENAGLTQQELGEAIGVAGKGAAVEISRYERGFRLPRVDRLYVLADALNVEPHSLLGPATRVPNPRKASKKKKAPKKRKRKKAPKKSTRKKKKKA